MGAYDTYAASASCPRCGDVQYLDGQTKVFEPDFGGLFHRHFSPLKTQPLDFEPSSMLANPTWSDEWWRVRDTREVGRVSIVADLDEVFECNCGCPLAPILHFSLDDAAPSATLSSVELADASAAGFAKRVDLASAEHVVPWTGNHVDYSRGRHRLARLPSEERRARLEAAVVRRFEHPVSQDQGIDGSASAQCWDVEGATRCEACGDTRTRRLRVASSRAGLFADGWSGVTRPGELLPLPAGWQTQDDDYGFFVRLPHPFRAPTLTVCGRPEHWGCKCGAGQARVILEFSSEARSATLRSIKLRSIRSHDDVVDLDFAFAPLLSRANPHREDADERPISRAEAMSCLLRDWGIAPE